MIIELNDINDTTIDSGLISGMSGYYNNYLKDYKLIKKLLIDRNLN
jgi:hypothetical protein